MGSTWHDVVNAFFRGKERVGGGWCLYHQTHYRDRTCYGSVIGEIEWLYLHHERAIASYNHKTNILTIRPYPSATTRDRLNRIVPKGCFVLAPGQMLYQIDPLSSVHYVVNGEIKFLWTGNEFKLITSHPTSVYLWGRKYPKPSVYYKGRKYCLVEGKVYTRSEESSYYAVEVKDVPEAVMVKLAVEALASPLGGYGHHTRVL